MGVMVNGKMCENVDVGRVSEIVMAELLVF